MKQSTRGRRVTEAHQGDDARRSAALLHHFHKVDESRGGAVVHTQTGTQRQQKDHKHTNDVWSRVELQKQPDRTRPDDLNPLTSVGRSTFSIHEAEGL